MSDQKYLGEATTDASVEEFLRRVRDGVTPAAAVMEAHARGEDPIVLGLVPGHHGGPLRTDAAEALRERRAEAARKREVAKAAKRAATTEEWREQRKRERLEQREVDAAEAGFDSVEEFLAAGKASK